MQKKICLLGDFAVGKTSLVRRFVYDLFDDQYISTIGVKVSRKTLWIPRADAPIELTLMVWDLAGSEEFNTVRASYLRGAAGAVIVCDLTRAETLEGIEAYAADFWSINPRARVLIAANKCDLTDHFEVSTPQIAHVAARLQTDYYLTSARAGDQVETLFQHLGQALVEAC